MAETVFSRIIAGEIPCHKVYEDDHVLAFLDIYPLHRGHVLIVPKESAVTIDQLSDESAAAVGRILPRVARAMLAATGATAYNVLQNNGSMANQAIHHVHFHLIPKSDTHGLGIIWRPGQLDPDEGKELALAMSAALAG